MDALDVLCAQLTRDLFAIAKFLLIFPFLQTNITSQMWPIGGKEERNMQTQTRLLQYK